MNEDPGFWSHSFRSAWMIRRFLDQSQGVAKDRFRLYFREFATIRSLRPPLPEQRKIAAILSSVDEVIEKTEAVIEQIGAVRNALRKELLTRGVPGRHTRFKRTHIGEVPVDWEIARIGSLFDIQLGKMLNAAAKHGPEEYPYLANRNVQWGRLDLRGLKTMFFSSKEREKYQLLPGDLLVCEGGEVGRTAIWRGELANCFFQKAIHRLRPRSDRIDSQFMLHFMRHAADMRLFVHLTGKSSIAHLTKEKLEIAQFAVPSIAEQRVIATALDAVDRAAVAEVEYFNSLRESKSALMSVLLTGEIRVTPAESPT
jgi:type I restriction enzyme, S subunit